MSKPSATNPTDSTTAGNPLDWAAFRQEMPVARRWAYMDHAAVAPLTARAAGAIRTWTGQAAEDGDVHWPQWYELAEGTRQRAAGLIGAAAEHVALVPNTTFGINAVAQGFHWKSGDNVVIPGGEFPSNLYPWLNLQRRGVETRIVPLDNGRVDLDRLADACDQRTRLIAASWVGYAYGYRLDVEQLVEIARRCGARVMLDAIQGLGVFPLDVAATEIDFLCADGHKWLLGPEGAGVFYIRPDRLAELDPVMVGWASVRRRFDYADPQFELRPDASRWEIGSQNAVGMIGLGASLEVLLEAGAGPRSTTIGQRVLQLTDELCDKLQTAAGAEILSCRQPECASGIVAFRVPGIASQAAKEYLLERDVVVSCRAGNLRASVHAYNDSADIHRLACALMEYQSTKTN